MSFLEDYFGLSGEHTEESVCCPFPHTINGHQYQETNPSASVNIDKRVFHCMACDRGYSEQGFIKELLGTSDIDAYEIQRIFNADTQENLLTWSEEAVLEPETKQLCLDLGISETVIRQLRLATHPKTKAIAFPAFMYGHVVDIRCYAPGKSPKVKSRKGSKSGFVIPYDLWQETSENIPTLICAGEKDMAVARSHGFNAITLTGGERALPKFKKPFANRHIIIVYDNDDTGREAAQHLADWLYPIAKSVKVCTGFHSGMQNGEDITDFFVKYHHSSEDLAEIIRNTQDHQPSETPTDSPVILANKKPVTLLQASAAENRCNIQVSNVQVTAVSEQTFACPAAVVATKTHEDKNAVMKQGETRTWQLSTDNIGDIIGLVDNNLSKSMTEDALREYMHILKKERYIQFKTLNECTVYKCVVTDLFETTNTEDTQPMEYVCYSINKRLQSGHKYKLSYRLIANRQKGSQLVLVAFESETAEDSVNNFTTSSEHIRSLQQIQKPESVSVPDWLNENAERLKSHLGYDGNNLLITTLDLAFHTVLNFNFGNTKNIRGYLDTLIIGESRVGKSSTAETLRNLYHLGTFTSLAGNAATIAGLIGGSNKTSGGMQTRAGIIPQNNGGLIIFEELAKSGTAIIKELTDVRSSNEVRISRVSGTITMPANVRMITLSNPKTADGDIRSISSYPNGIQVIKDLIGTAEDIARYDIMLVLADRGNSQIDPLWQPMESFPEESYRARIRWIWSRKPEQIHFERNAEKYLVEQCNLLNREYDTHVRLFGTEAWKKVARLSIAIAGYCVSTDAEDYSSINVRKEHIDAAVEYFKAIYDNDTFRLKDYVRFEKKFTDIDDDGIAMLQRIYDRSPSIIATLQQESSVTKHTLTAATGMSQEEVNKLLAMLTEGCFIKHSGREIIPTQRLRKGLPHLSAKKHIQTVGQIRQEGGIDFEDI